MQINSVGVSQNNPSFSGLQLQKGCYKPTQKKILTELVGVLRRDITGPVGAMFDAISKEGHDIYASAAKGGKIRLKLLSPDDYRGYYQPVNKAKKPIEIIISAKDKISAKLNTFFRNCLKAVDGTFEQNPPELKFQEAFLSRAAQEKTMPYRKLPEAATIIEPANLEGNYDFAKMAGIIA